MIDEYSIPSDEEEDYYDYYSSEEDEEDYYDLISELNRSHNKKLE